MSAQTEPVGIEEISFRFLEKQKTNEVSLRAYIDLNEGDIFPSYEDMEETLEKQKVILLNTRYYKSVEYVIEETENQNYYHITFILEDGWTILPKPYMLPNSDVGTNGWSAGLGLEYDNFFGTMSDFTLDAIANLAFGESIRLKMWEISPQLRNIKLGPVVFNADFSQMFDTTAVTKPELQEELQLQQHYSNYSSILKLSTVFHLGGDWTYFLSPGFGFNYMYNYHDIFEGVTVQNNGSVDEIPFFFTLENRFAVSRLDWVKSFRKGYSVSLKNSLSILKIVNEKAGTDWLQFVPAFSLNAKVYLPFFKIFNYYSLAEIFWSVNNFVPELGERLRGVLNSSMSGDLAFFWLNTIAIEIWSIDTLHIQLHPFVDMGIALNTEEYNSFDDKFRIGFGAEVLLMVGSVDLKGKYGYDPVSNYHDFNFMIGLTY
ncbi:hypothetical protein [Spirochaeta isovalerica]|uniref:Bacterial surface antigen (D15) domain-containing protein n=1 Tax=Spirochaeta isovalerica TaxID=150 RepID=A0A841RCK3_9SPIO|nr:hypothetical protein [Spirochaeta isovalerica]MBB6480720.1 hypothetical protein [Spirochaeta isovalerica]